MFRDQYRMPCLGAFKRFCNSMQLAHSHCSSVERQMCELARTIQLEGTSSSHLRTNVLKSNSSQWSPLRTNQTCLYCLRRRPEHVLPCAHSLCDACVMILGKDNLGVEYRFNITVCPLCRSEISFTARLKPPTAGVRIASIDGGGTRGVIPLEWMCLLQSVIPNLPLRDLLDLIVGTSSGNLVGSAYVFFS